jgi:LPS export ABC transporter protein LptC/lipopolysaccharide transport protein LptA
MHPLVHLVVYFLVSLPAAYGAVPKFSESGEYDQMLTDHKIVGFHLVETAEGRHRWQIEANVARVASKRGIAVLEAVRATFYSAAGTRYVVLGDHGVSDLESTSFLVEGNVMLKASSGYTFRTQRLSFDGEKQEIHAPGDVVIQGPDFRKPEVYLSGSGMTGELATESFRIDSDVRATRQLSKRKNIDVASKRGEFNTVDHTVTFLEDVVFKQSGLDISGDRLNIRYRSDRDFDELRADGGVRIRQGKRRASCERVVLVSDQNKMVLTGNPRLRGPRGRVTGRTITFFTNSNRVDVDGARAEFGDRSGTSLLKGP